MERYNSANQSIETARMVLKEGGNVGIGVTNPANRLSVGSSSSIVDSLIQVSHGMNQSGLVIKRNDNTSFGGALTMLKSRAETASAIVAGDTIGALFFTAVAGNSWTSNVAYIQCINTTFASGPTNTCDGNLQFFTKDPTTAPNERMRITGTGNVGIATTNPQTRLSVAGVIAPFPDNTYTLGSAAYRYTTVYAATGAISTSDLREKTDVAPSSLGLDFVRQLSPVSYKFKVGQNILTSSNEYVPTPGIRTHYGFIAQDVKTVLDNNNVSDFGGWILSDKNDPESLQGLRYEEFIAPLTKAIQEMYNKIQVLENKITTLESRL
jgi:hypothetical protein